MKLFKVMANERKNNLFKQVPIRSPKRAMFDLSHEVKMSGKFGYLYPVLCMDTLPGDTIRDTMNCMVRFAPLIAPVMHRCDVSTHFFFVPTRVLTDLWEDFITGGQDGTEAPILPYVTPATVAVVAGDRPLMAKGSLWDYLGLPVNDGIANPIATSIERISALPFKACAKVWNDFYRDPNLHDEMDLDTEVSGSSFGANMRIMMTLSNYRRAFEKDYFTSALPWAQRGAQVLMPLSGDATFDYLPQSEYINFDGTLPTSGGATTFVADAGTRALRGTDNKSTRVENLDFVEFTNATTTINDLRRALAIQKWLEANARGGARYVEQVESHFNVRVPDYRLQRAEYLGGGKQPVQISEVLTTAYGNDGLGGVFPPGEMVGHGISVGRTNRFTYRCEEHGYVVGFLSVTMRTAYSQGIPRMWSRLEKFDYAWPELAHLGEQEIVNKEVFYGWAAGDDTANGEVFGYIPRYAEYKFHNDRVAGDFRASLGFWHLSRMFSVRPALDIGFTTIYEDGDYDGASQTYEVSFRRIFAVQDGTDYLWMQLYHHLTAKRPLPYFGVPSI